jgi:hypothetical protein
MIERLKLPSGGWADVETRITFGMRRAIQAAMTRWSRRADDPEAGLRAPGEVIVAVTRAWSLVDDSGRSIPIDLDGVDTIDAADADALFERAVELFAAGTAPADPKVEPS